LLDRDPTTRITLTGLKQHAFFRKLNWEDVYNKKIVPPATLGTTEFFKPSDSKVILKSNF